MTNSLTFVTSLLYKNPDEKIDDILSHLSVLTTHLSHICIYVTNDFHDIVKTHTESLSNIKICVMENLMDSWVYKEIEKIPDLELPTNRNIEKDTKEFILASHYKHEILKDATIQNYWETTHFAWIDINIAHLFGNKQEPIEYLKWLNGITLADSFLTFPGCWAKLEKEKINDLLDSVSWRFCGYFFMGDIDSVLAFCYLHKEKFPEFLREHKKLIWDFNFWSWLETKYEDLWKPIWYRADHNDTILYSSADIYTRVLKNIISKEEYSYPKIEHYYPTSASYLYYNNKHYLNTRYVNYWIYPTGCYLFQDDKRQIRNKNVLSELDDQSLIPISYQEIDEKIDLPIHADCLTLGLEDIRLYEINGTVKYIASTMGYSPNAKSRMIIGKYDIEKYEILDGRIIQPPNVDSWCEKNWIPIQRKLADTEETESEELFIYKWFPIEIGKVNDATGELQIIHKNPVTMPIFSKIRGSTIFQEIYEGWIGVVHFSEEHSPRHYYHMLVVLDKDTFELKRFSETFCFEKLAVEFCIGFTIREYIDESDSFDDKSSLRSVIFAPPSAPQIFPKEEEYVFWISRHDRDPITITVGINELRWMMC